MMSLGRSFLRAVVVPEWGGPPMAEPGPGTAIVRKGLSCDCEELYDRGIDGYHE